MKKSKHNKNTLIHIHQKQNNFTPQQYLKIQSTPLKIRAYSFLSLHVFLIAIVIRIISFLCFVFAQNLEIK